MTTEQTRKEVVILETEDPLLLYSLAISGSSLDLTRIGKLLMTTITDYVNCGCSMSKKE
jgi:hypothetical protein